MTRRVLAPLLLALAACAEPPVRVPTWTLVSERVWRSPGTPAAYALVDGDGALLFGAPAGADPSELRYAGIPKVEGAYLTHHHRDSVSGATAWSAAGLPIKAPRASAPWITPEGVQKFWRSYLPGVTPPLQTGVSDRLTDTWDYLVLGEGLSSVDCSVDPDRPFTWRGWTITPVATPGHSRGHMAYAARRNGAEKAKPLVFCGDALAASGKLWTPYTTDWDPVSDEGLAAAAASLKTLLALDPEALFPEHGPAIVDAPGVALSKAAEAAAEAAFLKSYERFTKERVGKAPAVRYLDKTQVGSDGRRPWTRLNDRLFFTGGSFLVSAPRGGMLFVDPQGEFLEAQIVRAQTQRIGAGEVEVVAITHPHADHYGGLSQLPGREGPEVWVLDSITGVLTDPAYRRAPHAHPRPVRVARSLSDGESAAWRGTAMSFHRLAGHSGFGSLILAEIDGKRVAFVGDTFLHPDLGSGSGGWSGLNGGLPADYAESAELIAKSRVDWILCSRGGAFEFVAADWTRRADWGRAAAAVCDRLSPSGEHRLDWNPGLVRVEPFVSRLSGERGSVELVAVNPLDQPQTLGIELAGRGILDDLRREISVPARSSARLILPLRVLDTARPGTHAFPLRVLAGEAERGDDAVFAVEIGP